MDTREMSRPVCKEPGLYRPEFEHDNCGIGAVVNIKGIKTHQTVENALSIVENLEHRAGKDAEGKKRLRSWYVFRPAGCPQTESGQENV